ncbi:hypothetical protein N7495_001926 [Penicillium taxi]|uniref:uncharacterized protein n=1 Tax=Penicillium taxi TaxID=168475 RepID=UPI0025453255|nr:uncharacterized protein N7495_001926 [Penicillium taxi]KAJ5909244.1 hypothetical protein N7495_001926 [Penicillium taxi]
MQARGKRKCNRQYPCNHCTRRRRPDDCAYYPSETPQPVNPPAQANVQRNGSEQRSSTQPSVSANFVSRDPFPDLQSNQSPQIDLGSLSLAEVFGYSEDSHTNTLALLRLGGPWEERSLDDRDQTLSNDVVADFQQSFDKMPDRSILDFLVQYFVAEISKINSRAV